MPDRFQFVDKPPIFVGHCSECGEEIQKGYEHLCSCCNELVCDDCLRVCWVCENKQCNTCLSKKDANGEYICEICQSNREYLERHVLAGIDIESYYYSGKKETEDSVILEYSSQAHPIIRVIIAKVK